MYTPVSENRINFFSSHGCDVFDTDMTQLQYCTAMNFCLYVCCHVFMSSWFFAWALREYIYFFVINF